ncbi:MAG TPA: hypothetical protein VKT70_05935 [Stellaceae bacterium]|nr:hypothetical protein [Stellaceae bacterium]
MDIFNWVVELARRLKSDGQDRLADLMFDIADATVEEQHARVDAILPEALALARSLKLPWVEIYLRHWGLQSRVLHRAQGEPALAEAVSLLEFAHRPENRPCPQSVCVVQDLAACYGRVDGVGYAKERIAVAGETLARIDPSWPCFGCISGEMGEALIDAGRIDEARRFVEGQIAKREATGEEAFQNLATIRIEALIQSGEIETARALIEDPEWHEPESESERLRDAIDRARLLARLGRTKEARDHLPPNDKIIETHSHYRPWVDAVEALIKAGAAPSDAQWNRVLRDFADRLVRQGSYRDAYAFLVQAVKRALERGSVAAAALDLETAEEVARKLRTPEGVRSELDGLRDRVARSSWAQESAASPEDVLQSFSSAQLDIETGLERIAAARRRWPDHVGLAQYEAGFFLDSGARKAAERALLALRGKEPRNVLTLSLLANFYTDEGRSEECRAVIEGVRPLDPPMALWLQAKLDFKEEDFTQCLAHLALLLDIDHPEAVEVRRLGSEAARKLGDFATMLTMLNDLIRLEPDEPQHHWYRMVAATVSGDWERVRHSAAALGMNFDGEGPINVKGGLVRVRFADEEGDVHTRYAMRTGPVSAQIVQTSLKPPHDFRDIVVFDPEPTGDVKDDEAPLFQMVATLSRGGYRIFPIDGIHPGEKAWRKFDAALAERGGEIQRVSDDDYHRRDPDTHKTHPAIYAALAVPSTLSASETNELLTRLTAKFPHPLTWVECAQTAGESAVAERQEAWLERWEPVFD